MQEGAFREVYRGPSGEVPASTRAKVHSSLYRAFFGCCLIAILFRLQSKSAGTSLRNTALRKRLVSSYDLGIFLTSISFLQERVQKRVCGEITKKTLPTTEATKKVLPTTEATKTVLPKAEAPKQTLPKKEAIKKVLPKATEAIRKVLSTASRNYKW